MLRENASCACLAAVYGPEAPCANVPATETTLTTSEGRAASSSGRKARTAPDTAEVDGVDDLLGLLGLELEEAAPAGEARVVHEEPDRRMPLCDPGGDFVHLRAVGDVARLGLRADLGRHLLEPLGSAGDEHAVPASRGEKAGGRGSDSARPSRDDGDPHAATINSSRLG